MPTCFWIAPLQGMKPIHIQLDLEHQEARFSSLRTPYLEFRQALFHSPVPEWQRRLYPAALVVTTTAYDHDGRVLATEHQALRFSILYNSTWPEPIFRKLPQWRYKPLVVRKEIEVAGYIVELRLRDLRLVADERVELVLLA